MRVFLSALKWTRSLSIDLIQNDDTPCNLCCDMSRCDVVVDLTRYDYCCEWPMTQGLATMRFVLLWYCGLSFANCMGIEEKFEMYVPFEEGLRSFEVIASLVQGCSKSKEC